MSIISAQLFVSQMKTDSDLRKIISKFSATDSFWKFTSKKWYDFDAKDFVQAMAQ